MPFIIGNCGGTEVFFFVNAEMRIFCENNLLFKKKKL